MLPGSVPSGRQAFRAPDQGFESSFRPWIAWRRPAQRSQLFTDSGICLPRKKIAIALGEAHTCHMLPPLKWFGDLCCAVCVQAQKGHFNFTEFAERVEYGNYEALDRRWTESRNASPCGGAWDPESRKLGFPLSCKGFHLSCKLRDSL